MPWVISQDLAFVDPTKKQTVKSCVRERVIYNPMDKGLAEEFGEELAYKKFNPLELKYLHATTRMVFDGYEPITRKGVSKSGDKTTKSENEAERAKYREEIEQRPEWASTDEQRTKEIQLLLSMKPGYRMISSDTYVSAAPEYIEMLKDPWPERLYPGCAQKKLSRAIEQSQSRTEFSSPVDLEEQWTIETSSTLPANETKELGNFSNFVPLHMNNSSKPKYIPPRRKRGKGSNGPKNKGS